VGGIKMTHVEGRRANATRAPTGPAGEEKTRMMAVHGGGNGRMCDEQTGAVRGRRRPWASARQCGRRVFSLSAGPGVTLTFSPARRVGTGLSAAGAKLSLTKTPNPPGAKLSLAPVADPSRCSGSRPRVLVLRTAVTTTGPECSVGTRRGSGVFFHVGWFDCGAAKPLTPTWKKTPDPVPLATRHMKCVGALAPNGLEAG
jgi:hypothetical protein